MIRVSDLVEWILKHRTGTAFLGYSEEMILEEITQAMKAFTISWAIDNSGNIIAIAIGSKDEKNKIFYCTDVLSIQKGAIRAMMIVFLKLYPDYAIHGLTRIGRKRVFKDTRKLTRRLAILKEEHH